MICHSTTARTTKRTDNTVLREDVEQLEHTPRGNAKMAQSLWKRIWRFQVKHTHLP